ncbi:phosphatase PAP2 family protein [Patescibacteria group bacterium]
MNKFGAHKLLNPKIGLIMMAVYMAFLNLSVMRSTPEILIFFFIIFVLLFRKAETNNFIKDWAPYLGLFLLYEFLRGIVDDISPLYEQTLYIIHHLEIGIFGMLPTKILQNYFFENNFVMSLSLFFYGTFFFYSFVVAFFLWLKVDRNVFHIYFKGFLLLTYISLLFYFLFPTAPPWFVDNVLGLNLKRIVYSETILSSFGHISTYRYFVGGNPVAAFPSLHVAWPAFTSLFLIGKFGKRHIWTLIFPLMIGFSIVLTAEHYVLDVIAGLLFGYAFTKYHPRE